MFNIKKGFFYLSGYFISILKYYKKRDPFQDFYKMSKAYNHKTKKNKVALLIPLRVSPTSNIFEGLVAFGLRLRGYTVYSLMFGVATNYNENMNAKSYRFVNNAFSFFEQIRFNKVFATEGLFFDELINKKQQKDLYNISQKAPIESIFTFHLDDINIGKHVEAGVCRFLLKSKIDFNKNEKIIREFFYTALLSAMATKLAIKQISPSFAIMSHGCYSSWGTCLEVLKNNSIRTVVWGRGYAGKGAVVASQFESYLYEYIFEPKSNWDNITFDEVRKNKIINYLKSKRDPLSGVDHVAYYKNIKNTDMDLKKFRERFNISKEVTIVGLYPNIPWDGKMFSATEAFPDLEIWISETISWIKKTPSCHLVIRSHPAELACKGNETNETFIQLLYDVLGVEGLPSNVTVLPPDSDITSYQLSEFAECAIMYGSTLALEFSAIGHPVIQVGLTNSSYKGGVFDVGSVTEYHNLLAKIEANELVMSEEQKYNALLYAYHWIYRRHIPETMIKLQNLNFDGFLFNEIKDFNRNQFETFNWFLDRCEDGAPFVYDIKN